MPTRSLVRYLRLLLCYWLPLLAWLGWIYYLSDQPSLPHPARQLGISDYLFDYAAHAFTFGTLAWLVWRAMQAARPRANSRTVAALFAALYAASDELHQMAVRGRKARLSDWLADMAGIGAVIGLVTLWNALDVGRVVTHHLDG